LAFEDKLLVYTVCPLQIYRVSGFGAAGVAAGVVVKLAIGGIGSVGLSGLIFVPSYFIIIVRSRKYIIIPITI
jgi:hypothetical protein